MKYKLLIIGASGHGKVVADIALNMNKWENIAFLDDNETIQSSMGIDIIGKLEDAYALKNDYDIFVAIGDNLIRANVQAKLEAEGATIPTLIHPTAAIGRQVELSPGTVVMAGAIINCCTNVSKGCIINTGATVDHDSFIEEYVHVSPGSHIAGTVRVGRGTWLGAGSVVSNNIYIKQWCIIGAGTVVVKDINETGTYVGVPARKIEK
ncbi:acetyltransferase [Fictibacillus sp. WQ 8-8]|uniref:acetyltransferase n=1 Tax=Fictibacillus sp. WQ 8-8 TaxID=2938788 RepID=UPI00210B619C|nr:acetyltransferase [Fictibacillus sp. WQ 8-8]MCQ6264733.1 acetyltransferase [Fictibacillus sp. WQ 8-8]